MGAELAAALSWRLHPAGTFWGALGLGSRVLQPAGTWQVSVRATRKRAPYLCPPKTRCLPASLPPRSDGDASVFDILKANFDAAYSGNRAPFPIFIHSPWLREGDRLGELKKFVGGFQPHVQRRRCRRSCCCPSHLCGSVPVEPGGLGRLPGHGSGALPVAPVPGRLTPALPLPYPPIPPCCLPPSSPTQTMHAPSPMSTL